MPDPNPDFVPILQRLGVLGVDETFQGVRLAGGVSSDIWRVETPAGPVCVKRALPKLKVSADWYAPVERNAFEVAWFETVAAILPDAVPQIRAHDDEAGLFTMDYLEPDRFPVWKDILRRGNVNVEDATAVGTRLVTIHARTAADPSLARRFASDELFRALRLDPYLESTAQAHPRHAGVIREVAAQTATTRRALVHGDVSPKNLLLGPKGPVFLDAECAWWGDPAFDVAFCLNHLLLKSVWVPTAATSLSGAFDSLSNAWLAGVDWEPSAAAERRAARLLPALLLARIDGTSPVEYITAESDRARVRRTAERLLAAPVDRLAAVAQAWNEDAPR